MVKLTSEQSRWLAEAYRAHSDRVFATCLRFGLGDRDWAKERTHDVFSKMAERIEEIENVDDPGGWLYRVAVNECFMALRRRKMVDRALALFGRDVPTAPSPERAVQARRDLSSLARTLASLPPKQRAVMVLVHLEGHSQTEAAELLSMSKGYLSKLHTKAMTHVAANDWEVPRD